MILVLHTTARYLAVVVMVYLGTIFAAALMVRRVFRVRPAALAAIQTSIAQLFHVDQEAPTP